MTTMKEYVIFTDSTSDLPVNMIEQCNIGVIPMAFQVGSDSYLHYPDAREIGFHDFYQRLRAGETSVTTQINYNTYIEYFSPLLQEGRDVLYISFSSALSGTYNASLIAAEDLMAKYPGSRVVCVDSRAASVGEGMLVYYAAQKKQEGLTIDELKDWILANRSSMCHWFTVDDLNHLKRGGRVSAVAAVVGTALGMKPILHVDDQGRLIPVSKTRGRKKSLEELLVHMKNTCVHPDEQVVFIGHGDSAEDAEYLAELVKKEFAVKDVILSYIGPVIGTHSGPGTIALFFIGSEK